MLRQMDGIAIARDLGEPDHIGGLDSLGMAFRHPNAQVVEVEGLQRRQGHGALLRCRLAADGAEFGAVSFMGASVSRCDGHPGRVIAVAYKNLNSPPGSRAFRAP